MTSPAPTTKAQVQAYRFGMRRLENAVATGQSYRRTIGGPRHGLSFVIGVILAALVLAGFAVYAFISPEPSIGNAKVVVDSDNGGAYVVRNKHLYPALNLASAMLAAGGSGSNGSSRKPAVTVVDSSTLATMPKAQTLGISGAPNIVPGESSLIADNWTVCDVSSVDPAQAPGHAPDVSTTVVLGRRVVVPHFSGLPAELVAPEGSQRTYLVWGGRRSLIDTTDHAVALALGTNGVTPRPISPGLLQAIPAGADIVAPTISGVGQPVSWDADLQVGTVFQAHFSAGTAYYVALSDGAERVSGVVADLVRADHESTGTVPTVALSTLKKAPVSTAIDQSRYPAVQPTFYSVDKASTLCLGWTGGSSYSVWPTNALPLTKGASAVPAPPGSTVGTANAVYVQPGHGAVYGQVIGNQSATTGALFLVTDTGLKYPVVSRTALTYLGLNDAHKIRPAPPALIALLPTGPTLDPAQATVYYSGPDGH